MDYWQARAAPYLQHYLCPLATAIKAGTADSMLVWVSPYYVGNYTQHPQGFMLPDAYADFWGAMFANCSAFDLIAPQDSMGAQGNRSA